jgi:hypothetical protein
MNRLKFTLLKTKECICKHSCSPLIRLHRSTLAEIIAHRKGKEATHIEKTPIYPYFIIYIIYKVR